MLKVLSLVGMLSLLNCFSPCETYVEPPAVDKWHVVCYSAELKIYEADVVNYYSWGDGVFSFTLENKSYVKIAGNCVITELKK